MVVPHGNSESVDTEYETRRIEPADHWGIGTRVGAPGGHCEEWGMRAFWSRRNDEHDERYRARTVDRLRGRASTDVDGRSTEPTQIRARVERLKAETKPDSARHRGSA